MEHNNLLITDATLVTPLGDKAVTGDRMSQLHEHNDTFVAVVDGVITKIGFMSELPAWRKLSPVKYTEFDAKRRVIMPGFVDSHTHLIFGGYRPDEFGWRLRGDAYMDIMRRGGGIQCTVDATRQASESELYSKAKFFLDRMAAMGVTTVEAKSGYGLDLDSERKMLAVIHRLAADTDAKQHIVATFLGAHAVPREYTTRTSEYVDYLIDVCLPEVKGLAEFCDVFCEKDVFEIDDSRRLLTAARDMGYKLKLHADEIVTLGGAGLAAELGAVSADHLLHIADDDIQRMAQSGVVATLLPLTAFALKEPYAPARKLIDGGAAVALATDLNPGSCFSGSIPLTIALACIYMNMSIEETITAMTLNGAAALGRADRTGSIEEGKDADIIMLDYDNYRMLPYYVGMNCVHATFMNGSLTAINNN